MAAQTLPVKKSSSIFEELETMHDRILKRAYDIFDENGQISGKDFDHWLQAERELSWKPSIELSEKDGEFLVTVAIPGIEAKDLQIEVTPDEVLVKGESRHEHKEEEGKVHICELESRSVFRSIEFPKKVDTEKVKAEFRNGVLIVKAAIAKEESVKKKISAATA